MKNSLLIVFVVAFTTNLFAQQPSLVPSVDTTNYFFQPGLTISMAPLALADYNGGHGMRVATEYTLKENFTGLTEVTYYLPFHNRYANVKGFRIRQDFRKYNSSDRFFIGGSIMVKNQSLDYIAVIPMTDSTHYRKPYTLKKLIVSPSLVVGQNAVFDRWYFEACLYVGLRIKNAYVEGLTQSEKANMWNYDVEAGDLQTKIVLRQDTHLGIEISPTIRIGYILK